MDYQIIWENAQSLGPPCPFPGCTSGYSNEDFPSDYLGFVAGLKGLDFETAVGLLGGGKAKAEPPPGYVAEWPYFGCSPASSDCARNNQWTLKVRIECGNDSEGNASRIIFVHRPWPSYLTIPKVDAGRYWTRWNPLPPRP